MTKKNLWLGILAIALVFTMTVVGCGGGDDGGGGSGGGSGGKVIIDGWTWGGTYIDSSEGGTSTITMTQGSGNDRNKLTFSGNVQKIPELTWGYAGCYVMPNSANLASLKNADSFSFKCRGDGKQYIIYVDTSDVPENSRFRKTFTASTTDNTITVQYSELEQAWNNTIPFNKNNIKGILFEAFLGTTGEGPFNITMWDLKVDGQGGNGGSGGGTFTLTGIPPEYNGKYAFLQAYKEINNNVEFTVWGFKTITMTGDTITLPVISNGSVSIPLWILTSSGNSFTGYSGNHTLESVGVGITNIQSTTVGDFDENGVASIDFSSVAFSNGSATRSWSQGNSNSNTGGGENGGSSSIIEMVSISAGTFTMGSPTTEPSRESDETQHSVTLSSFKMGKYQVTQEQYQAVMGSNPSYFSSGPQAGETQGKRPVECVSWYDAIVFCNKLSIKEGLTPAYSISGSTDPAVWGSVPTNYNTTWDAVKIVAGSNGYRLPTEAQWEYACRAGTTTAYNTGATISDNTGWYRSNSADKTHQVGLKPANAWGLYDMHGNVVEWCWDWYGSYPSEAQTNPMGASSGSFRILRSGHWDSLAGNLRSATRGSLQAYRRDGAGTRGFRLVRP
jgi:formylglycine-generating enzyme required for sulfatase activity